MNQVNLIGRLTKDAELKTTNSGKKLTNFTLAVRNRDEADFINCIAWEKTAEIICKYTTKGSQIGVTGRIATRNYDGSDGRKVYITEIVVSEVELLEKKPDRADPKSVWEAEVVEKIEIPEDDLPF